MEECLISSETSKLARKKGCNLIHCTCGGFPDCICRDNGRIPQSLLQKWLREIHHLHLIPILDVKELYYTEIYHKDTFIDQTDKDEIYESSLENALQITLKLIK